MNDNGRRPDGISFDDVEDKESVQTPEQRKKTRTWAYGDVMPALPRIDPEGKATMTALGTLLHGEALLTVFMRDPRWTCIIFGAHDRQGDLIWPMALDESKLAAEKTSYMIAGELPTFYLEYYNTLRGSEAQKFRPEFFPVLPCVDAFVSSPSGLWRPTRP